MSWLLVFYLETFSLNSVYHSNHNFNQNLLFELSRLKFTILEETVSKSSLRQAFLTISKDSQENILSIFLIIDWGPEDLKLYK